MIRKLLKGAAIGVLPLFVLAGKCGNTGTGGGSDSVPKPGDPTYRNAVSAFYSQVIAAQVNDADNRVHFSDEITKLAPGEPAGWANIALGYIRQRNGLEADKNLKRAEELAPGDPRLLVLRGLVLDRLGKFDEAVKTYQEAAAKDPQEVEALYYTAQAADSARGPDEWKIKIASYEEVLKRRPGNGAALIHLMEALGGAQDKAGLQKRLPELIKRAELWPDAPKQAVTAFAKKLPTLNGRALRIGFNAVKGYSQQTVDYQIGLRDMGVATYLQGSPSGSPITLPFKLVAPSPSPAQPDTGLSYESQPLGVAPATATLALALNEKNPPSVFVAGPTGLSIEGKTLSGANKAVSITALDINDEVGAMKVNVELPDRHFLLDAVTTGPQGLRFYKNSPAGFSDATGATGLPAGILNAPATGAWAVDFEADGDLDLIVSPAIGAPVVLQNNGNGKFTPLPGKLPGIAGPVKGLTWADFDNDGDPDLAVIDGRGKLHVLANQRSGIFEPWEGAPNAQNLVSLAIAETSNDANLDILTLSSDGTVNAHAFISRKWEAPKQLGKSTVAKPTKLLVEDLDNNGGVDFLVVGADKSEALLLGSDNSYTALAQAIPLAVDSIVDLNADGVPDFVGRAGGKATKALAKPTKKYHYQNFTLVAKFPGEAQPANKINAYAIGGEIEARAGLWYRKLPITGPQIHIGLGENPKIDAARVIWPNGNPQGEFEFKDTNMVADQRLGGSCPFLFAWDGKEFRFVTDCIWRSPLGLKINAQATAGVSQTEDWVKIRGDQLVAKDGFYDLRITAELRETHFFDHLSLMTVDHPEGTDIWVDERFSPAEKPLLKVITTKTAQPVAKALGFDGKDAATILSKRDGDYLDDFGRGQYQGVTKDHWVEIELPESAPKGVPLYLIAHGWLHPTDSSLNVALSQNTSQAPPQGLSLWTPDGSGSWKMAKPGLGFPEGKLKTVVLRVDDAFQPGAARKLRLRTNLEVYWDQIQWAEGVSDSTARATQLVAGEADLRYRGFSHVVAKDASSPELPTSYSDLAGTAPRWRDLEGCYTRFGPVDTLLSKIDDRYVIMNAGDELALRFKEAAVPAAGMVRDFVLIGDGWVKDGNVNTEWGQTVYPLPSHSRTSYPRTKRLEDDPVYKAHQDDFLEYHTRWVTPDAFVEAMRP